MITISVYRLCAYNWCNTCMVMSDFHWREEQTGGDGQVSSMAGLTM